MVLGVRLEHIYVCLGMHLLVGIGKAIEVSVEVCSKSLPIGLLSIPVPHAYVPGVLVIVIYEYIGIYLPDGILFGWYGKHAGGELLFFR